MPYETVRGALLFPPLIKSLFMFQLYIWFIIHLWTIISVKSVYFIIIKKSLSISSQSCIIFCFEKFNKNRQV